MKNTALILLGAIALASARSTGVYRNGCPANWSEEKLLPHPNCNRFYQCWDGKLVPLTCPSKLYFSIEQNRCEWAEVVDCVDREVPDDNNGGGDENGSVGGGNSDPSLAPEICAAEGSDDVLVANENCNQFYICAHGQPIALSCPDNLLFNPQNDRCDWPKNVDCGDRVIPEVDSEETDENTDEEESDEDESASNEDDTEEENDNEDESAGNEDDTEEEDDDVVVGGGNDDPSLAPEICAAEGSDDVLVANQNCNQFYICDNGKPVVQSCPSNLLFNPQTDRCDWPKNVECGDRVIPEVESSEETDENTDEEESDENESAGNDDDTEEEDDDVVVGGGNDDPSLAPEICAAEGSDDVLVANQNCNQFYICDNGKPVVQSCPSNLVFNPQTDRCDWPKNVDCGDRVIPEVESSEETDENTDEDESDENESASNEDDTEEENDDENESAGNEDDTEEDDDVVVGGGNDDPSLAPEICAAEGSDDVLVANQNCNQFYICANGKPVVQSCPNNLLFNPQTDRCDWPKNVVCGDRVIPEVESSEETDENTDEEESDENESAGNDDDTEEDDDVVVGGGNDDPSLAPEICAAEGSDDVLVANQNCNQFYICANGKPVVQSCPNNLLFNPQTDRCDWPKNVDCGDRVIPEVDSAETDENTDEEESDENESAGNEDDTEEENDDENESAGNEDNTEEEDDEVVVGGGNDDPSLAPEICAAEGSDDVLVANENCNQFYVCANGKPVVQSCPNNLLFNPQTDRCDWPKNVDCGDRVIPDVEDDGSDDNENEGNDDGNSGDDDENDADESESDDSEGDDSEGNDSEDNDSEVDDESEDNDSGSGDQEVVGGGNSDPSEAPEICATEGSDNVLVANEDCSKFYICANGKPLAQKCPANLLFNPQIDRCDWPKNVVCGDRVIPDPETDEGQDESECVSATGGAGNDDPRLASEICASEISQGVLVAHEDCNKFYVCDHGIAIAVKCPATLLFNPYSDRCDWSSCVNCSQRVSLNKHLAARQTIRSVQ